ncbi:MAG TPA: ABC transporter ATP-binding protein, partial [Desulfosporosinus sp.]|nr:ABC transporter ATP-binding protein [Desulfosporosinus sp.]
DLYVRLSGKDILKGINLAIPKGEFISLLGPSGCGKTTLIKTIAGLLQPEHGEIFIRGKNAHPLAPEKRGTVIVFQDLRLFPNLNVIENVEFGMRMKGVPKSLRQQKALGLLEKVEMTGFEKRRVNALSGGQKQRVALARAIAAEPSILLLDEPFTSLDVNTKEKMIELVLHLHQDLNMTTVMVTHDQRDALLMSARIAVMYDGKILQYDTSKRVYEAPASPYVANYFGKTNYLEGMVAGGTFRCMLGESLVSLPDGPYRMMIRPNHLRILGKPGDFQILSVSFLGDRFNALLRYLDQDFWVTVGPEVELSVRDRVSLEVDFSRGVFYKEGDKKCNLISG